MSNQIQKIIQLQDHLDLILKQLWEINKNSDVKLEKTILCNSGVIEPGEIGRMEILAGRGGAFKSFELQLYGIDEHGQINQSFELVNITVMGCPQLINYNGLSNPQDRGLIKSFEISNSVDFNVFGSSRGQGLEITLRNMNKNKKGVVYASLKGITADCSLIGRA